MAHLLALDQGTTSSRAFVFDEAGRVLASAQREFEQIFPRPGLVEHDPEEIWRTQAACADEAMRAAGLGGDAIDAVGITNQRETTVVWDRQSGEAITNAIVWQDRRTAELCSRLVGEGREAFVSARSGLVLDPYFSATKIAWILDSVPGARARAERGELAFGTIDSWLIWKLSGGTLHVSDPSNASRTLLFDLARRCWDEELLELFGIPRSMLPEVVPSAGVVGRITAPMLARGAPIAGLIGDQQAATMGQLALHEGMAKNTYGTGCFLLMNTGSVPRASSRRLLSTLLWDLGGDARYALEGSVFTGGAAVQWLRDGLGIIRSADEIEALASRVDDSGGVVFVPALTGLGAPHWDSEARGLLCGITRGSSAAHVARATLEGIAFQIVDLVSAMEEDAAAPLAELRVDGGAAANDLLLQIQADLLQRPVVRPTVLETTALGAAYLAGLGAGIYRNAADLEGRWSRDRVFEPSVSAAEAEERIADWRAAVARARLHS